MILLVLDLVFLSSLGMGSIANIIQCMFIAGLKSFDMDLIFNNILETEEYNRLVVSVML